MLECYWQQLYCSEDFGAETFLINQLIRNILMFIVIEIGFSRSSRGQIVGSCSRGRARACHWIQSCRKTVAHTHMGRRTCPSYFHEANSFHRTCTANCWFHQTWSYWVIMNKLIDIFLLPHWVGVAPHVAIVKVPSVHSRKWTITHELLVEVRLN